MGKCSSGICGYGRSPGSSVCRACVGTSCGPKYSCFNGRCFRSDLKKRKRLLMIKKVVCGSCRKKKGETCHKINELGQTGFACLPAYPSGQVCPEGKGGGKKWGQWGKKKSGAKTLKWGIWAYWGKKCKTPCGC